MQIAFANCNDPYAWIIRGLVQYGWEDISANSQQYPKSGLGFDLTHIASPISHYGIRLLVLAKDTMGVWYRQDGAYQYEIRLVRDISQQFCLLIRSDEMAFSKLIPWTPNNPEYAGGYIHEAVQKQTPYFVERRKKGGGVSSIDIQEMLNHPLIPPPANLVQFVVSRLQMGRDFNQAIADGLWTTQRYTPPVYTNTQPDQAPTIPQTTPSIQQQNTAHLPPPQSQQRAQNWTIQEGLGRGNIIQQESIAGQEHSSAMVIVEKSADWLYYIAIGGMFMGVLAVVNALFTAYMVHGNITVRGKDSLYTIVIAISFVIGFIGIIGGWASFYCNKYFRRISSQNLALVPIIFAGVYPLTIYIGLPIAIFAYIKWNDALVRKVRSTST